MSDWRVWFADGSTISSEDCSPADVPGYGVQVFAQPDPTPGVGNVGWVVLHGYDWYAWHIEDGEWFGVVGDNAIWDLILHREPITGICAGRRISKARYEAIVKEAEAWAEQQGLPRKSARRWDESPR